MGDGDNKWDSALSGSAPPRRTNTDKGDQLNYMGDFGSGLANSWQTSTGPQRQPSPTNNMESRDGSIPTYGFDQGLQKPPSPGTQNTSEQKSEQPIIRDIGGKRFMLLPLNEDDERENINKNFIEPYSKYGTIGIYGEKDSNREYLGFDVGVAKILIVQPETRDVFKATLREFIDGSNSHSKTAESTPLVTATPQRMSVLNGKQSRPKPGASVVADNIPKLLDDAVFNTLDSFLQKQGCTEIRDQGDLKIYKDPDTAKNIEISVNRNENSISAHTEDSYELWAKCFNEGLEQGAKKVYCVQISSDDSNTSDESLYFLAKASAALINEGIVPELSRNVSARHHDITMDKVLAKMQQLNGDKGDALRAKYDELKSKNAARLAAKRTPVRSPVGTADPTHPKPMSSVIPDPKPAPSSSFDPSTDPTSKLFHGAANPPKTGGLYNPGKSDSPYSVEYEPGEDGAKRPMSL